MSIFTSLLEFLDTEKADIAGKVVASATYDLIKNNLNLGLLKDKIGGFFRTKDDTDRFVKELCDRPANADVENDLASLFKEITQQEIPSNFLPLVKDWLSDNRSSIDKFYAIQNTSSNGIQVGVQKAKKIFNIQGDYVHKAKKK